MRTSQTKEYVCWTNMRQRCYNNKRPDYQRYGKKGIKVCRRWLLSFTSFLKDMGKAPSPSHSIDRKNSRGNYTPSNCRWATPKQQANNRDIESARLKMMGNKNNLGFRHTKKFKSDLRKRMLGNKYLLGFRHSEQSKLKTTLSMPQRLEVIDIVNGTVYPSIKKAAEAINMDPSYIRKMLVQKKHSTLKLLKTR